MSEKFILADEFVVERSFAVEGQAQKIVLQLAMPARSWFAFDSKKDMPAKKGEKDMLVRRCVQQTRGWNLHKPGGAALPLNTSNAERVFDVVPGLAEAVYSALVRGAIDGKERDAAEKKPLQNSTTPLPGATPGGKK